MSTDQLLDQAIKNRLTTRETVIVRDLAKPGTVLTMSTIAQRLGIHPAAATVAVDRLVRRGIVARSRTEHDRRVVGISLTFHGRRLILAE
jgi:DNA-binding MarR family transcriptional regulator